MPAIENRIVRVTPEELASIKAAQLGDPPLWWVEIDGGAIQSWLDYIRVIQREFHFPERDTDCGIDAYNDWMRDLQWLEKDKFVLVINNFGDFLTEDQRLKRIILEDLADLILPFWENEVETVVVGGTPKPFLVYLMES